MEPALPHYFDAVKLLGTGNSTGLFGALVAYYYFGTKGSTVLLLLKFTAAAYLTGVCLFTIAFFFLFTCSIQQYLPRIDEDRWWLSYGMALICGVASFVMWWVGTGLAVAVLILLPTS